MRRLPAIIGCLALAATPARAHLLKVFATVEDDAVSGYGFFIGGGRPRGAAVIVRDAEGRDLWRGETDREGRFSWRPDKPTTVTVIVNAKDGHVAEAKINADRFAQASPTPGAGQAPVQTAAPTPTGEGGAAAAADAPASVCSGAPDAASLASLVDQAVNKAVERQVRPLLEAYERANGAARISDIVGGVGMIAGLAGLGMWAYSRRRRL